MITLIDINCFCYVKQYFIFITVFTCSINGSYNLNNYIISLNSFAEGQSSKQPHPVAPHGGRKRQFHPAEARRILKEWYDDHIAYPYLTDSDVEDLARNGDITEEQVKKWMANKRVRSHNTLKATGAIHPTKLFKMQYAEEKKQNPEAINKHKKPRTSLPPRAVEILKEYYYAHVTHPYLTDEQRKELAEAAGITETQVSCWFANTRNRNRNTKGKKRKRCPASQSESDVDNVKGANAIDIDTENVLESGSDTDDTI